MPLSKFVKCPQCHGFGKLPDGKLCKKCNGKGEVEVPARPRSDYRIPVERPRVPHAFPPV